MNEDENLIECTKCGQCKSTDSFVRDSSRKTGRFAWCKDCVDRVVQARKDSHIPVIDPSSSRSCNRCQAIFPLTPEYFNVNRSRRYGYEYECKLCKRARRWPHTMPTQRKSMLGQRKLEQGRKLMGRMKPYYMMLFLVEMAVSVKFVALLLKPRADGLPPNPEPLITLNPWLSVARIFIKMCNWRTPYAT